MAASQRQSRLLIVDDIPENIKVLGAGLQHTGYIIVFAPSGGGKTAFRIHNKGLAFCQINCNGLGVFYLKLFVSGFVLRMMASMLHSAMLMLFQHFRN